MISSVYFTFFIISAIQSSSFLHITDIHIDPKYLEGASLDNGCHYIQNQSDSSIEYSVAGKYGAPLSSCDSPMALVEKTFEFISSKISDIDFIIWTGDNARHDTDVRFPRKETEIRYLNVLIRDFMIQLNSQRDIPIIPSIGNNDVFPHNTLSFDPEAKNPTLKFFSDIWKQFIPNDQIQDFRIHGSFSRVLVIGKLIGISLNTMYLFSSNPHSKACSSGTPKSPGKMVLKWLKKTLKNAKQHGMNVYISGHIPPSSSNWVESCYYKFANLCKEFNSTIKGQFYGHMNIDHFYFPVTLESPVFIPKKTHFKSLYTVNRVPSWLSSYFQNLLVHYKYISKDLETVMQPIMVSPSVVPAYNPGVRLFKYDKSGNLLDYDQFYCNLNQWNQKKNGINDSFYELEYQPQKDYYFTSNNISSKSWINLAKRLVKNNQLNALTQQLPNALIYPSKSSESIQSSESLLKKYFKNMVVQTNVT